jgi:inhibitor of cysteine peptidase
MKRSTVVLLALVAAIALLAAGAASMGILSPREFGAGERGGNVTVNVGEVFRVTLPENPSTGYTWDISTSDGLVRLSDKYTAGDRSGLNVGVGGSHTWEFKATKAGSQSIAGVYRRQWENASGVEEHYLLNVNVVEGGILSRIFHLPAALLGSGSPQESVQPGANEKIAMPGEVGGIMPLSKPMAFRFKYSPAGLSAAGPIPAPAPSFRFGAPEGTASAAGGARTPQVISVAHGDAPATETVSAKAGDTIRLSLSENPSTGYSWQMSWSDGLEKVEDRYIQGGAGNIVGAPGTHEWTFKATKPGAQSVSGVYKRPWEGMSAGEKRYTLNVFVT